MSDERSGEETDSEEPERAESTDTEAESEPEPEPEPEPAPTQRAQPAQTQSPVRSLPFGEGAFAGLVAYILGYLITYVATNSAIRNSVIGAMAGDDIWRAVGLIFYNAHYVDAVGELNALGFSFTGGAVNFIANADALPEWLFLVPPVLLLIAGGVVGYRGARRTNLRFGVMTGLTVVPGYLAPVLVGAFLFRLSTGPAAVGPEPVTATFVAGIVYPAIIATIGAVIVASGYRPAGREN